MSRHPNESTKDDLERLNLCNACSVTDCTGLIPSAPLSDNEIESYEDLYNFEPDAAKDMPDSNV